MFLENEDVALLLIKEGLAKIDEYAADRVSKEITEGQEEAKRLKKNVSLDFSHDPVFCFFFLIELLPVDLVQFRRFC